MKCIVCLKKIPKNGDMCKTCDRVLDMIYKNKMGKEKTLKMFREIAKKEQDPNEMV